MGKRGTMIDRLARRIGAALRTWIIVDVEGFPSPNLRGGLRGFVAHAAVEVGQWRMNEQGAWAQVLIDPSFPPALYRLESHVIDRSTPIHDPKPYTAQGIVELWPVLLSAPPQNLREDDAKPRKAAA